MAEPRKPIGDNVFPPDAGMPQSSPPFYAAVNANGTLQWEYDPMLAKVSKGTPAGSYRLEFRTTVDNDMFIVQAKSTGSPDTTAGVIATVVQDEQNPTVIYVNIVSVSSPHDGQDAPFSYIRSMQMGLLTTKIL